MPESVNASAGAAPKTGEKHRLSPPNYSVLMELGGRDVLKDEGTGLPATEVTPVIYVMLATGLKGTAEARAWVKRNVDKLKAGTKLRVANLQDPIEIKTVEIKKVAL